MKIVGWTSAKIINLCSVRFLSVSSEYELIKLLLLFHTWLPLQKVYLVLYLAVPSTSAFPVLWNLNICTVLSHRLKKEDCNGAWSLFWKPITIKPEKDSFMLRNCSLKQFYICFCKRSESLPTYQLPKQSNPIVSEAWLNSKSWANEGPSIYFLHVQQNKQFAVGLQKPKVWQRAELEDSGMHMGGGERKNARRNSRSDFRSPEGAEKEQKKRWLEMDVQTLQDSKMIMALCMISRRRMWFRQKETDTSSQLLLDS